ncbi:MAG: hypothetical protein SV429_09720 [Pseudomonadota bacterium]|nr:hypothetical protein [Pseudomonadota bacterium]
MTAQKLQRVVVRVCTYLAESGVTMNRSNSRRVLKMLDEVLSEANGENGNGGNGNGENGEDDVGDVGEMQLLSLAMDRLPAYFPVTEETIPALSPALLRGSIRYPHG